MSATEHVSMAFAIGMKRDEGLHRKWIAISHKLGSVAGTIHTIPLQRIGRLDMLLRVLEDERLKLLKTGLSNELDLSLDLQSALSENWLLSAYEVARAAKKSHCRPAAKMRPGCFRLNTGSHLFECRSQKAKFKA